MAQYQLLLPKMGESVAEATITKWLKKPGDVIEVDDTVLEIATDKVDSEVPSPVSGKLIQQLVSEDQIAQVGDVIAIIETGEEAEKPAEALTSKTEANAAVPETPETIPGIEQLPEKQSSKPVFSEKSSRFYSPLVRSIAAEEGISLQQLDSINGSGAEGRVTKDDILTYIKNRQSPPKETASGHSTSVETPKPTTEKTVEKIVSAPSVSTVSGEDEIIEMDRMRRLIADHMVKSKQVAPHVSSFVEADVTNIVTWRERVKATFEKREGEKLTFTPIFVKAVIKAIKDFPMINVSVNGTQIIKKKDINIGLAAALPSGNLIVPVIHKADQLNMVGLAKSVNDLASRARLNKLKPDEVKDGTFTITNIGTFGNILGTPIINQPEVAILAIGAIKKKPAVIETEFGDMIGIRHMMFLSLSYDHRVVDGFLGGSFLKRIADYLEAWDIHRDI